MRKELAYLAPKKDLLDKAHQNHNEMKTKKKHHDKQVPRKAKIAHAGNEAILYVQTGLELN